MIDWSFLKNPEFWAAVFASLVIVVSKAFPDWADTFEQLSPLLQTILLFIFGAIVVSAYVAVQMAKAGLVKKNGHWQKAA